MSFLFELSFAGLASYILIFIILIVTLKNVELGFILLLATQFSRISRLASAPRLFSPIFIELIVLILILFFLSKKVDFLYILKKSKIFFIWIFSHITIRLLHKLIYNDTEFSKITNEVFAIYIRLLILFLIVTVYLMKCGNFQRIVNALFFNMVIIVGFILLEAVFGISYNEIFRTLSYEPDTYLPYLSAGRYGVSLISGPFGIWEATGKFMITCLPLLFLYDKLKGKYKNFILVVYVIVVGVLGARAAFLGLVLAIIMYLVFEMKFRKMIVAYIGVILIFFVIISYVPVVSSTLDYYLKSFSIEYSSSQVESLTPEAFNLANRVNQSYVLFENVLDIPIVGYGWSARPFTYFPFDVQKMEVNVFLTEAYDYGVLTAFITIMFFMSIFILRLRGKIHTYRIGIYAWLAIFISLLSNGNQLYVYYVVPITFYAYWKWELVFSPSTRLRRKN